MARLSRALGSKRIVSLVLLAALCGALFLPGISTIPPIDRDEARFAQATRQMVKTRDFVRPRFQDEDRFQKPIGAYWAQAVAVILAGRERSREIWPYRLPSALGAMVAVFLTAWIGTELFNYRVAVLAAALLASSALLVAEAHVATADSLLLAAALGAQGCLAKVYVRMERGEACPRRYACGFWLCQGLAILLKGLIVAAISTLTVAALMVAERMNSAPSRSERSSEARWTRALGIKWGPLLTFLVAAPWFVKIGILSRGAFFREALGRDFVPIFLGSFESHGAPFGYYLALAMVTFWPASLLIRSIISLDYASDPALQFCLAWLAPSWIALELVPTKLPHYVLPLYPPLALLASRATYAPIPAGPAALARAFERTNRILWAMIPILAGLVVIGAPPVLGPGVVWASVGWVSIAIVVTFVGFRLASEGRLIQAAWAGVISAAVMVAPTFQWIIPQLDKCWLSRSAATEIAAYRWTGEQSRPVAALGYSEPSLVFMTGGDVQLIGPVGEATWFLKTHPDGLLIVSSRRLDAFERSVSDSDIRLIRLSSIEGINYSKGRQERLILFERSGNR